MWQVLHGALPVAALLAVGSSSSDGYCHHPGCRGARVAETVSHVFLGCPVAQSVTAWAGRLWSAAAALPAPPPAAACTFLTADPAVWDPGGYRELWDIIRTTVVYFLWVARDAGRREGRAVPALAVAAQVVQSLRARIAQDDVRARLAAREITVLGGQWVPDRPVLTRDGLLERWGPRLCQFGQGPGFSLQLLLTLVHPVPPPPG